MSGYPDQYAFKVKNLNRPDFGVRSLFDKKANIVTFGQ
jgi:hypothetical protein